MSFTKSKKNMEEGDTVLLHLGYDNIVPIQLTRGRVDQTKYGAIRHDSLMNTPYGRKIQCPKGWLYPLQLTAELWTLALPHRTQILYSTDISLIILQLHLRPGSVVVEAGTGSGSLSHVLIRSVMPTGHLYTYEFHAERCSAVQKEFELHGLSDFVTVKHHDVCDKGFPLDCAADAVFLDLPSPWECIKSAKQVLQTGGRICTFSPCIEQVQRSCDTLREHGFEDLITVECLAQPYSVQTVHLQEVDFGDAKVTSHGSETRPHKMAKLESTAYKEELKTEDQGEHDEIKEGNTTGNSSAGVNVPGPKEASKNSDPQSDAGSRSVQRQQGKSDLKSHEFKVSAPSLVRQGHTGFLTFASLYMV